MLEKRVLNLHLLDICQYIKKYIIFTLIVVVLCIAGCGVSGVSDEGIDEIEIYITSLFSTPTEMTVIITDPDKIEEIDRFFQELEYGENPDLDNPPEVYFSGKWDFISFKKNGKIIKKYSIMEPFVCNEEFDAEYVTTYVDLKTDWEDHVEKVSEREWYYLSDEEVNIWQEYVNQIFAGTLGTVIE